MTLPRVGAGSVSEVHLLCYSLLARTTSNFSGVLELVRAALLVEAQTLTRSCVENSFYLFGLLSEGESFVRTMMEADVASRDVRGQAILERTDGTADDNLKKDVQSFLKALRQEFPKARSTEPKRLAYKGPLARAYLIYSHLSANSVHPSITSLQRYVATRNFSPSSRIRGFFGSAPVADQ